MIDTGNTLTLAVKTLHERGAKSVHALISHGKLFYSVVGPDFFKIICYLGLLSETNMGLIEELPLKQLVVRCRIFQGSHRPWI